MQNGQVSNAVDRPRCTLLSRAVSRITIVDKEGGTCLRKSAAATFARSCGRVVQLQPRSKSARWAGCSPPAQLVSHDTDAERDKRPSDSQFKAYNPSRLRPPTRRTRPPMPNAATALESARVGARLHALAASSNR